MLQSILSRQFLTAARCFAFALAIMALAGCSLSKKARETFQEYSHVNAAIVEITEDIEYIAYEDEELEPLLLLPLHNRLRALEVLEGTLRLACRALLQVSAGIMNLLVLDSSSSSIKVLFAQGFCAEETVRVERELLKLEPGTQAILDKSRKETEQFNADKARNEREIGKSENIRFGIIQKTTN